ncbi:MAG TPA: hypothetical protein G4O20_07645 [Dehalococcoidia bacterium]|nr:hypothetical protein [Dehalococcoidia bacterium]
MQELLTRIRRLGFVVVLGVCIIIYIGLGIVYMQQGPKQKELEDQVRKTMAVVNKPLPSMEELQAKYDAVNAALAPMETPEALEVIVDIAEDSGIDVNPESGKFHITAPGKPGEKKLGEGTYYVLSFENVRAQSDFDTVMDFISDIDAGKTLETMILRRVNLEWVQVSLPEEEALRRAEFRAVIQAVADMMEDNVLVGIPNPASFEEGLATNEMIVFPDAITTAEEKGYTGTGIPLDGYVLYEHDRITADNTSDYQTVTYIDQPITEYYYTCEADGTVRQFDGPDVESATEYFGSEEAVFEVVARLAIDLYSKPGKG